LADISVEVAAIEAAANGEDLRQPLIDALDALNKESLPAVTALDAGKILKVNSSGEWVVGEKSGYMPVPTASLNITENGTIDVLNYAQAVVAVSGGGGVELMLRSAWDALTTEQKRAKGLVAIQEHDSGYNRGILVNGTDFVSADIIQSGTAANSVTFNANASGNYKLLVIALNSEASTYSLDISVSINGTIVQGVTKEYNSYYSSGTNRRNYRIYVCDISINSGDEIIIQLTNRSNYTSFVYAIADAILNNVEKSISTADATASGSNTSDGLVVYGTFNSSNGGTINMDIYNANDTITTRNPGSNYRSAYIFWFDE
jgi:hypothetical protein